MSDRFHDALKGAWEKIERGQWLYGNLGKKNGDGSYTFIVPGRPTFVYVTLRTSSGAQTTVPARNDAGIPHEPKLSIKMKLEYGVYVIYGKTGREDLVISPPSPPTGVHSHASTHQHSGSDEIATATPTPNQIPKAEADGKLADSWIDGVAIVTTVADAAPLQATLEDTNKFLLIDDDDNLLKYTLWSTVNGSFVRRDGTAILTGDWDIGEDRRIKAEALRARDNEGLKLETSTGVLGILLADDGNIGVAGTPKAWNTNYVGIDIGQRASFYAGKASTDTGWGSNAYYNTSNLWKSKAAGNFGLLSIGPSIFNFHQGTAAGADETLDMAIAVAMSLTDGVLQTYIPFAKTAAESIRMTAGIGTRDVSPLELRLLVQTSPTAANRWTGIQSHDAGVAYVPLRLNPYGGEVLVGGSHATGSGVVTFRVEAPTGLVAYSQVHAPSSAAFSTFYLGGDTGYGQLTTFGSTAAGTRFGAQALAGAMELLAVGKLRLMIGTFDSNAPIIFGTNNIMRAHFGGNAYLLTQYASGAAGDTSVENILQWYRPTVGGISWENNILWAIGRYSNANTNANTRLDLKMNNVTNETPVAIMTWKGTGAVGINNTNPSYYMDIQGELALSTVSVNQMFRMFRPHNSGISFYQDFSIAMGRYVAGVASNTRVDFLLNDGNGDAPTAAMTLRADKRVGIGTVDPTLNGEVYSRLTVRANDALGNYIVIINDGAGQAALSLNRLGGTASRWVMYVPSGDNGLAFYNDTAIADVLKLTSTKRVGMGTVSAPQGVLHIHDASSGFMKVSINNIVGTPITIIPDGTGDVTTVVKISGLVFTSNPTSGHIPGVGTGNSFYMILPGNNQDHDILLGGGGTNVLRFSVSAGGALSVVRQAGSLTWHVTLELVWR